MVVFKDQLRRQMGFLENSCKMYDAGNVEEAVRLAVTLRVLFHDTKSSTSLLTSLQAKSLSLVSTRTDYYEDSTTPNLYLVQLIANLNVHLDNKQSKMECRAFPQLDRALRKDPIPFKEWWKKECVIKHKEPKTALTRRDLILGAANKDGGAHVDTALDPIYDYVRKGSGLELEIHPLKPELGLPFSTEGFI